MWPGLTVDWPVRVLLPPALTLLLRVGNSRLLIMSQELYVGFSEKRRLCLSFWFKMSTKVVIPDIVLIIYACFDIYLCYLDINLSDNPLR